MRSGGGHAKSAREFQSLHRVYAGAGGDRATGWGRPRVIHRPAVGRSPRSCARPSSGTCDRAARPFWWGSFSCSSCRRRARRRGDGASGELSSATARQRALEKQARADSDRQAREATQLFRSVTSQGVPSAEELTQDVLREDGLAAPVGRPAAGDPRFPAACHPLRAGPPRGRPRGRSPASSAVRRRRSRHLQRDPGGPRCRGGHVRHPAHDVRAGGARRARGPVRSGGDRIATLVPGHAGCPVAACLHWGLLRGSTYLNPLSMLRPQVRLLPVPAAAGG